MRCKNGTDCAYYHKCWEREYDEYCPIEPCPNEDGDTFDLLTDDAYLSQGAHEHENFEDYG